MGMTYMDGKAFLQEFLNEDPKDIINTQFVLVSSRIRKTGDHKNVMNTSNTLYPSPEVLMGITEVFSIKGDADSEFEREYRKQLQSQLPLLASIIKAMIIDDMIVVFLCSKKERKLGYLKILSDVIYEKFGYLMLPYKKCGDLSVAKRDLKEVYKEKEMGRILKIAEKILSDEKKKQKNRKQKYMMRTEKGREKLVKNMKTSEMKKYLKKRGYYSKIMTKEDMQNAMMELM